MLASLTLWLAVATMPSVAMPVEPVAGQQELVPLSRPITVKPPEPPRPPKAGSPVPEPATLLLVGTGLVGLAISSRRWRRSLGSTNS